MGAAWRLRYVKRIKSILQTRDTVDLLHRVCACRASFAPQTPQQAEPGHRPCKILPGVCVACPGSYHINGNLDCTCPNYSFLSDSSTRVQNAGGKIFLSGRGLAPPPLVQSAHRISWCKLILGISKQVSLQHLVFKSCSSACSLVSGILGPIKMRVRHNEVPGFSLSLFLLPSFRAVLALQLLACLTPVTLSVPRRLAGRLHSRRPPLLCEDGAFETPAAVFF